MRFSLLGTTLACLLSASAVQADDGEWQVLFDGESIDSWQDYKGGPVRDGWIVEDGALVLPKGGGGDICTKDTYGNFEFSFEWKISEGGNSGIIYLSRAGDGAPYMSGPEYQILDDSKHADGRNPKTSAGALYALIAADGKELKPVGEWNTGRIVKRGEHLEHWVNGRKVVDTTMHTDDWNQMVADSKFNAWEQFGKTDKGHICLQDHGNKVWYRDLKIRELKTE